MKGVRFKDIPAETITKLESILEDVKKTEDVISFIKGSMAEKERKIRVAEDLKLELEEDKKKLEQQEKKLQSILNERI